MRIFSTIIPAIAVLLTFPQIFHGTRGMLRQAEELMEQYPDSALRLLEEVPREQLTNHALRARHSLLYSQALDKNYIDLTSDSVIAPVAEYYAKHGSKRDKAFMNYYLGRIRNNAGYQGEAAKLMLKAAKYAEPLAESKLLSMIYNCRANLYFSQYSLEEALQMYDKADSCARIEGRMANSALMIHAKAKTYTLLKKFDDAEASYRRAMQLFDSLGNNNQVTTLASGLATMAVEHDRATTDSIKQFLKHSYSKYTSGKIPQTDYLIWTYIYYRENKPDSARYFCKQAMMPLQESADVKCGRITLMGQIEQAAGNYRKAAEYMVESRLLLDSINDAEKKQFIQQVEKRYQNQELQHQNEILRMNTRLILSFTALIVSIISFSFVLILRHRRAVIRRKSKEIIRHRKFIDHLCDNYNCLKEEYDRLSDNMNEDSEEEANLLHALENRLTSMQRLLDFAYTSESKPQVFFKAFKEQTTIMNRNERAFSDLQYLVNKRHCGIIDYLRKSYPVLTNSELDMLSMIIFGFSFDCIRLIYHHDNVDSLYSRRTKIREKLQLPPRFRLERYLEELVEQRRTGTEPDTGL